VRDRDVNRRFLEGRMPPYFFVPLQVYLDAQMQHARFATMDEFIQEVVTSFARHAPHDNLLIFKHHPMDRPYRDYSSTLDQLRRLHGVGDRLLYVDVIHLPSALRGARGTVVMNSTAGLSSIHHGTPVKCLGNAVYDMPGLTYQGSLDEFWLDPGKVDSDLYHRFRWWLRTNNQLNGSVWSDLYQT
jgi:capsule polysaccharide modification protein KpsS